MFFVIRLVGETDDQLFKNVNMEPTISRFDLLQRIEKITCIPMDFQEVMLHGDELPESLHPLSSAKEFDEISVQHLKIPTWKALLSREETFRQTYEEDLKKSIHRDATALIGDLVQANFFIVYPSLGTERFSIEITFYKHFARKVEQIKDGENSSRTFNSTNEPIGASAD